MNIQKKDPAIKTCKKLIPCLNLLLFAIFSFIFLVVSWRSRFLVYVIVNHYGEFYSSCFVIALGFVILDVAGSFTSDGGGVFIGLVISFPYFTIGESVS